MINPHDIFEENNEWITEETGIEKKVYFSSLPFDEWLKNYGCPNSQQPCWGCELDYSHYVNRKWDEEMEKIYGPHYLEVEPFTGERFYDLVPDYFERF